MQKSNVITKLQEIHHNLGHDDDLIIDKDMRDQGYDSLDTVEFTMSVEREFGISVDDTMLDRIKTPNDVVELIVAANGE